MIHKTTRSILSVLLAVLLLVTSIPLTPAFADGGGVSPQSESGESRELKPADDGVYQIGTAEELREFAKLVNGGKTDADAILTANIDLNPNMEISEDGTVTGNPDQWIPIGNEAHRYTGTFDGNGKTISGLYINRSADDQGLFGYVSGSGKIEKLTVSGSVSGHNFVGGIAGRNGGNVINCAFSGSVSGNSPVGGVVGWNDSGTVTGCIFSGPGSVSGKISVGGVVGGNSGSNGVVENCYNTGTVTGTRTDDDLGGVGGVVGYNSGTVKNCYNTGKVTGSADSSDVGGVVGWNRGNVKNCYNTGSVTSSGNPLVGDVGMVGGVVGLNDSGTVKNCYNIGEVSGNSNVGGVVGDNGGNGNVTDCYFLQTADVNKDLQGIGNDSGGATPLSAEAFESQESFTEWDFADTWRISQSQNRPVLQANAEDNALSGTGKQEDPYKIYRAIDLKNFRDLVNGKDGQAANPNAHAKLMNNIDLKDVCGPELDAETSWTPIGNSEENAYTGTFNGQNFKISGLYIKNTSSDYQGLFGRVNDGTVKDLTVSGTVSGNYNVGGVVGYNNGGTVTGCIFSGSGSVSVTGGNSVGGVVGQNFGSVENCYNIGDVSGNRYVGGVVGDNRGTVENCYNTGTVSDGGISGGVVGCNQGGSVQNCYNTGAVSGSEFVGGVVGYNLIRSTVENCYNTGSVNVSGNSSVVGGVVGYNSGSVTGCYFLQGTAESGIGENEGSDTATAKDDTAFHSGEVAWRLQDGQAEDQTTPVWGQNIGEDKSWPTLVALDKNENAKPVYKVAFISDNTEIEAEYANSGMTVDLPATEPTKEGYTFSYWQDKAGTQVTEPITVTADTEFTAQWTKDTVNYTVSVSADPEAGGTVTTSAESAAEGTQVTVTATPATGYHFVNWTENGTEVSTGATFTFNATVDRNLIAIFEKDPEPTPTPTPDPEPSGPSTGDSTGWDDILDELENTAKGDEITIDMGDETKVPAEIFETLAGQDITLEIALEGGVTWTVNGQDIPADANLDDLDLGVNLDTSGIPVNVINTITGEVGTVQITLAHDGEFGFTMTLTAPLGKENAGYWANLYHYDEDAEALNFEAVAKIDEDGSVTIPFSHASQYAIVIDTHSHATVDVSDLFIDIAPDAWYKDAVQYAYDNGLMTGVSATEFAPEATTTRAMIVSILARLENVTTAQAAGFADVDDNDWYATAVNWAANVGVVNGYEDNTFQPNTAITREQLAAILMNYAAYKGEDVSNRADLTSYTDQPSTWAEEAMQWAVAEKLISGVTADTLQPQGAATRAQVAAILQRFLSE